MSNHLPESSHGFASDLSAGVVSQTPPDLVTWLREQVDEDERVAQATAGPGRYPDDGHWEASGRLVEGIGIKIYDEGGHDEHQAAHIARHDPARALREVEAKRRVVDECARTLEFEDYGYTLAAIVLKSFALAYADRPGYREEWRP